MAKRTIRTSASFKEVQKLTRDLPGILSGRLRGGFGLHKIFWGAIAYSLFTDIHNAFVTKSYGFPDELGDQWADLSQHTKAYKRPVAKGEIKPNLYRRLQANRRMTAKQFSSGTGQGLGGLGLLTPGEYKRWRKIFGSVYHRNKDRLGDSAAKAAAGEQAWTKLKEMGAKTMWDVLGNRQGLLIMRVSDRLCESVAPGKFNANIGYSKRNPDQIFIIHRGSVTLGTQVPYVGAAEEKGRDIWPEDIDLWIDRAVGFGRDVVAERLAVILR